MNKISRAFRQFHRLNIIKTVIFNFKMLPFKQAIKFPIYLYGKVDIKESNGRIELKNVTRGMIQVGATEWHELFGNHYIYNTTIFKIQGVLKVTGGGNIFDNGCVITVMPTGVLTLSSSAYLGPNSRLFCENSITMGTKAHAAWDVQIFDTNFHYIYDGNGIVRRRSASIEIGSYVWIGNRVTICKGSVIPSHCIVASNSMVNKDFSTCRYGMLVGTPAKHFPVNKSRLFPFPDEYKIRDYFIAHPDATEYNYGIPEYHNS